MASKEKDSALSESSKEAKQAATTARERISRLEAEHALALRENGKASVRQRALERELARIKNRCACPLRLLSSKKCRKYWEVSVPNTLPMAARGFKVFAGIRLRHDG